MKPVKKNKQNKIICLCNGVSLGAVEEAIRRGCRSLGRIYDATTAGVGPCGGSCQPDLKRLLAEAEVGANAEAATDRPSTPTEAPIASASAGPKSRRRGER
jgi:NAD(P)H-nitrite reductase large subunit